MDAINDRLRDANESLSKQNVERVILCLNANIKVPRTYNNYLSQMKWFRNEYNGMSIVYLVIQSCNFEFFL